MAGTPVKSGAICGGFLSGQKVCGQVEWTAPFTAKVPLLLGGGVFQIFSVPPVVASLGKPQLLLSLRSFVLQASQSPPVGKPQLLLGAKQTLSEVMLFAQMGMPALLLGARAFLPSLSTSVPTGKPVLELNVRGHKARIPALIPTEDVDLILVPADEVEGDLIVDGRPLLIAAPEGDLLLVPTTEAVG